MKKQNRNRVPIGLWEKAKMFTFGYPKLKPPAIFIGYATENSSHVAVLIRDRFIANRIKPYLDSDLPIGVDWEAKLMTKIQDSDDFIVVLAPGSLDRPFLCREIRHAIDTGCHIIPVLHGGLTEKDLTSVCYPELVPILQGKQAIRVLIENAKGYDDAVGFLLNYYISG